MEERAGGEGGEVMKMQPNFIPIDNPRKFVVPSEVSSCPFCGKGLLAYCNLLTRDQENPGLHYPSDIVLFCRSEEHIMDLPIIEWSISHEQNYYGWRDVKQVVSNWMKEHCRVESGVMIESGYLTLNQIEMIERSMDDVL